MVSSFFCVGYIGIDFCELYNKYKYYKLCKYKYNQEGSNSYRHKT